MTQALGETTRHRRLRLLLIQDDPDHAGLVKAIINSERRVQYELVHAPDLGDARRQLAHSEFDAILLDLNPPDSSGLETVRQLKELVPNVPIVVMTATDDEEIAIDALKLGAQDYLVKSQTHVRLLPRTVRYAVERQHILDELDRARREQLQFKDAILSHVSHEVRTPLSACHQFVTLLLDEIPGKVNEEQRDFLRIVFRNLKQLSRMVADLLDLSRSQNGKLALDPRVLDMGALIEEIVRTWRGRAQETGLDLEAEVASLEVIADEARARQILSNLIENAFKFTPAPGTITLRCAPAREPGFVEVSVSDTGCGIRESALQTVFERLHQESTNREARKKGLGLGLHITRELVINQGGRIDVQSRLGEGSTFRFTLPAFDLSQIARPALCDEGRLRDAFTLLRVRGEDTERELAASIIEELHETVRSTLYYPHDVLLPRRGGVASPVAAIVATDPRGRDAVVERLRARIDRSPTLRATPLRIEAVVETIPREDPDSGVGRAAERIRERLADPGAGTDGVGGRLSAAC